MHLRKGDLRGKLVDTSKFLFVFVFCLPLTNGLLSLADLLSYCSSGLYASSAEISLAYSEDFGGADESKSPLQNTVGLAWQHVLKVKPRHSP